MGRVGSAFESTTEVKPCNLPQVIFARSEKKPYSAARVDLDLPSVAKRESEMTIQVL